MLYFTWAESNSDLGWHSRIDSDTELYSSWTKFKRENICISVNYIFKIYAFGLAQD